MPKKNEPTKNMTRREMLTTAAGGGAALAALIVGAGISTPAHARRGRGRSGFTFEVQPDFATMDFTREIVVGDTFPTGPFFIEGTILQGGTLGSQRGNHPSPGDQVGTFRSWGWILDGMTGAAVVSQEFDFPGAGKLQLQGTQDDTRAVTGGTGQFRNVRGEGYFTVIDEAEMSFSVSFKLQGAGGRLKIN